MSPEGRLNLDRKAGLLQIKDYLDRLDKIANDLDVVESRILRQVHIQAKVIEVEMNEQFSAGIDWSAVLRSAANSVTLTQRLAPTASQSAFTMGVNIKNFKGLLNAFASQGRVNVMASPRVMAMNNEPAVMQERTTGEKTKVPVLGDMPPIGGLFRRDDRTKKKVDLVILLTPTVVTPGDVAAMSAADQQRLYEEQRAPELRQLDQRVSIRYELKPLTEDETAAYIYHRLYVAGGATTVSFTPKALRAVFQSSGGIPRLINLICDRSLLGAFSTKANKVAHDLVIRATKSLDLRQVEKPRFSWLRRRRPLVAGFGTSAVSGA